MLPTPPRDDSGVCGDTASGGDVGCVDAGATTVCSGTGGVLDLAAAVAICPPTDTNAGALPGCRLVADSGARLT
jgi:hypothetical protein